MAGPSQSPPWPGVPLALASAALFGASAPFAKLLVGAVEPQMLAGSLYLSAGLGLGVVHVVRARLGLESPEAPLRAGDLPRLVFVVVFGGIIGPLLLMLGLVRTSASSGSLLLNLEGLATMAIAWIVFRENVDRRLLLGAAAILSGAVVLSWQGTGVRFDAGGLLIAGACLAWGIDNNLTRKISATDPVIIAMLKGLVAGGVNVTLGLAAGSAIPPGSAVLAAGLAGFMGVGVSLVLFIRALRYLGTARTGAYYSLAPFIGAVIAIAAFGEPVTLRLLIAAGLMGFGLYLHLAERHDHEHTHDALEHEHSHVHDEHHQHRHDGPVTEPHSHWHRHEPMTHKHAHYPDLHHQHRH